MSKSKMQWSQEYVRATSCKYSVIIECCDPPVPAHYLNTNNEKVARRLFEQLKSEEIEAGGGGEFSITLYKHRKKTKIKYFRVSKDEGGYDFPYVYGILYQDAEKLDEFNYGDMAALPYRHWLEL